MERRGALDAGSGRGIPCARMSAGRDDGIADDADAYADLDGPEQGAPAQPPPRPKAAPRAASGIANDADLFADILEEGTDKARSLDTNWLYQQQGQVFGPVKSKELLEMLYKAEVDAETLIAVEDGEFAPLRRIGVFRAHLPKVQAHLAEVREAEEQARHVAKERLKKRATLIGGTVAVVVAAAIAIPWYVISSREAAAEADKEAREDALRKELDDLLASVTIEPPLLALVDEPAPTGKKSKKRRRRRGGAVASFSGGAAKTGELTREEIMAGVAKAFSGFKRCIVGQMQRDPESVSEQIVLRFSVNNAGRAQNVSLKDRFLRRSPLNACMTQELGKVRWRAYKGEVRNVDYPITVGRR